jgi:hypothetical protein
MARRKRTRLLAITLLVLGLVASGCTLGGYRYLDSIDWFVPRVDARELQARAQREQPVGGGEAETITYLRKLGFENQHILIRRLSAPNALPNQLVAIEGWIPQPRCCLQPQQIRAYCTFDQFQRLRACTINIRGSPLEPSASGNFTESTPVPVP